MGLLVICLLHWSIYNDAYNYIGTDLSLTVIKNNTRTMSDFTLYKDIDNNPSGTPYAVDLLDNTYGLSSNIQDSPTIWYQKIDPNATPDITATLMGVYNYQFQPKYTYTFSLGAVEYRANNYYWLPQTYYYQMGGVFLSQSDGVSLKFPPSVSFTYNKPSMSRYRLISMRSRDRQIPLRSAVQPPSRSAQSGIRIQGISPTRIYRATR